jgi:nucleoid-associated protein YgaU
MTSDAKVGLLLGLFFIFVIAFIINGLPRFHNDTNGNELTTMPNNSFIGSNERKAQAALRLERPVRNQRESIEETQEPTRTEGKFRYKMPLSQDNVALNSEHLTTVSQEKVKPTVQVPDAIKKVTVNVPKQVNPRLPKIYVVQAGDNLAKIAQNFYGTARGNKTINVNRIFEANRRLLKSPDAISVGQKLVIPLLKAESKNASSGGVMGRIKSTISRAGSSTTTPTKTRPKPPTTRKTTNYTVREGDSLWRIAEKKLGDKERFREIIKLNALDDEDYLKVGQRLLIPAR